MSRLQLVICIIVHSLLCNVYSKVPRRSQAGHNAITGSLLRTAVLPTHCGQSRQSSQISRGGGGLTPSGSFLVKRIVGGRASRSGEWPWLVTLRLKKKNGSEFEHTCGGTLIHRQWVVTAAHCFESLWASHMTDDPSAWQARVGEHRMFSDEDEDQEDVDVESIIIHPSRNPPKTFNFDIAMVKLSRPVRLSNNVNVVCLPAPEDRFSPGTICITAGWGHSIEGGQLSETVQHVEVPIISRSMCNKLYQKIVQYVRIHISNDMLCAGFETGGSDACQYDSGGPMVYYNRREDSWMLVGVVSTGYGCARPGFPGIYTKVSEFVPWIQSVIAQSESEWRTGGSGRN